MLHFIAFHGISFSNPRAKNFIIKLQQATLKSRTLPAKDQANPRVQETVAQHSAPWQRWEAGVGICWNVLTLHLLLWWDSCLHLLAGSSFTGTWSWKRSLLVSVNPSRSVLSSSGGRQLTNSVKRMRFLVKKFRGFKMFQTNNSHCFPAGGLCVRQC